MSKRPLHLEELYIALKVMANVIEGTEPMLSGPPKKIGIGDAVFGVSVADILREAANAIKKARPYETASPYETVEVIK